MTDLVSLIADCLTDEGDVEAIEGGFRLTEGEDVTELTFRHIQPSLRDNSPATAAAIETRFAAGSLPKLDHEAIPRLNRLTVLGAFALKHEQISCRVIYPFREPDPNPEGLAYKIIDIFLNQIPVSQGIAWSRTSKAKFLAARKALAFPREWSAPVPDTAFDRIARTLAAEGRAAMPVPAGLDVVMPLSGQEAALLRVTTGVNHPIAGAGYLATLLLPPLQRWRAGFAWCAMLNAWEHAVGNFGPRLGAWGLCGTGDQLVYGLFWPETEGVESAVETLMRWMIRRAEWIRNEAWVPGTGLIFREMVS